MNDHWSAARKLAMDLGVRHDFERLPDSLPTDANNISPRVGLAYQPAPKWVVQAGYGIFYDRYVLAALNQALQKNGATAFEQVADSPAAALAFQSAAGAEWPAAEWSAPLPGVPPPSVHAVDRNLATSYSQQASLAVEHELAHRLTASATFLLVRGVKLSRTRNLNLLAPIRSRPGESAVRRRLRARGLRRLHVPGSYVFAQPAPLPGTGVCGELHTFQDPRYASDFTEQPQNPFALAMERALSRQDQRHRLVVNGLWELPIGDEEEARGQAVHPSWLTRVFGHLEIAPILTVESGRPVDPLTGVDNGSHPYPLSARPPAFGRNSFRTPLFVC